MSNEQLQVNAAALINKFISNEENTMNSGLAACVGFWLDTLSEKYNITSEESVDNIIKEIKEQIDLFNNEKLNNAFNQFSVKMNEDINLLDNVTFIKNGQEKQCIIPIKTTLAIVYKALTDQETCINLDDLKSRLESFNNMILEGGNKGFNCHLGWRHQIAGLLDGVYPEVNFPADIVILLYKIISETKYEILVDLIKKDIKSTICLVKSKFIPNQSENKFDTVMNSIFENSKNIIQNKINTELIKNGIHPNTAQANIKKYLDNLSEVDLPKISDTLLKSLVFIFNIKTIENIKNPVYLALDTLRKWIENNFDGVDENHTLKIINAAHIFESYINFYTIYSQILKTWNQEEITEQTIEALLNSFKIYFADCMQDHCPPAINQVFLEKIFAFNAICKIYEKNHNTQEIADFFALFSTVEDKKIMQLKLLDDGYTHKIMMDDTRIKSIWQNNAENGVLYLNPYWINRIFLQAIIVDPAKWTEIFFDKFKEVLAFVKQGFHTGDNGFIADHLKKDTYPEMLLTQLDYLEKYYDSIKNINIAAPVKPDSFYIPMAHFSKTPEEFLDIFKLVPDLQKLAFLKNIGINFVKITIKNGSNMSILVWTLPPADRIEYVNGLSLDFLTQVIRSGSDMSNLLLTIPEEDRAAYIKNLGTDFLDFLKKIICNGEDMKHFLSAIPASDRLVYIKNFSPAFLKGSIKNAWHIGILLCVFPESDREKFIQYLGIDFLKKTIKNSWDIKEFLCLILEEPAEFMKSLGGDFRVLLKEMIKTLSALTDFLESISGSGKIECIQYFGRDILKDIIKTISDMTALLQFFPQSERGKYLYEFDINLLKDITKTSLDMQNLLHAIPDKDRMACMKYFGFDFLQKIIKESYEIQDLITVLPKNDTAAYIQGLGIDFLKTLFSTNDLKDFLQDLVEDLHAVLSADEKSFFVEHLNLMSSYSPIHSGSYSHGNYYGSQKEYEKSNNAESIFIASRASQ